MNDRYYSLVKTIDPHEFSIDFDTETMLFLNAAAPAEYHYVTFESNTESERVELYEYVGEADPTDAGELTGSNLTINSSGNPIDPDND